MSTGEGGAERVQRFALSDELWAHLEPLVPKARRRARARGGRPRLDPRVVADAIFFVLRTGCQWKAVNRASHGVSGSSAHGYFQEWVRAGTFQRFWEAGLQEYDEVSGIQWDFQSMDGAMTKAPLGGAPRARIRPIVRSLARRGPSKPMGLEFLSV